MTELLDCARKRPYSEGTPVKSDARRDGAEERSATITLESWLGRRVIALGLSPRPIFSGKPPGAAAGGFTPNRIEPRSRSRGFFLLRGLYRREALGRLGRGDRLFGVLVVAFADEYDRDRHCAERDRRRDEKSAV